MSEITLPSEIPSLTLLEIMLDLRLPAYQHSGCASIYQQHNYSADTIIQTVPILFFGLHFC